METEAEAEAGKRYSGKPDGVAGTPRKRISGILDLRIRGVQWFRFRGNIITDFITKKVQKP